MRLHENKELFQDAVIATSQQKGIREIYIEKDYWVTFALYTIFNNKIGKEAVFKGGTSLLKCFGLIQRFSEDIDLVIKRSKNETGNQQKSKLKKISNCLSEVLPEVEVVGLTNKLGMIRKTVHAYERLFTGNFGQVRDNIILESTWLGSFEPYTKNQLSSFIYEMMLKKQQHEIIDKYALNPFEVTVLNPQRTLCEKIMSLVRFSQTTEPITNLRNKIRHIYDLHLLLNDANLNSFFYSDELDEMLLKVAGDDIKSFKNNNDWLFNHPSNAIIFSETEKTWNQIKNVYTVSFSEMVFGDFANEKDILRTLVSISDRLKTIRWNFKG